MEKSATDTPRFAFPSESELEPLFRALTVNGKRMGIRLEEKYWSILQKLSEEAGTSISNLVLEAVNRYPDHKNTTSLIRTIALKSLEAEVRKLRASTTDEQINCLVNACPSPTFVLLESKRLHGFNAAFLHFVKREFAHSDLGRLETRLRLQLDKTTGDLISELHLSENVFVQTGFVLGMDSRRVRGQVNVVKAPNWVETSIICYVI